MRKPTGQGSRASRVDELVRRGLAAHQAGRLDEARVSYDAALVSEPAHPAANHLRGLVHLARGEPERAVVLLARAVAARPDEVQYLSNLAVALNAAGRGEEALVALDRALGIKPQFAEAHSNRGMVLRARGRKDAAVAAYREAVRLRPDEAGFHFNLGNVLEDIGDHHDALDSYGKAASLKPGYGRAHAGLSRTRLTTGDGQGALESARRAVSVSPKAVESYQSLGRVLREMGQLEAAEQAFLDALALAPNDAEVLSSLARIRVAVPGNTLLERIERAYKDSAQPVLARARLGFALGKVLGDLGQAEKAVATYADAGRLQQQVVRFDLDASLARLERIADNAAGAVIDAPPAAAPGPIFLVGLPRSGKTTIEVALSRHADVAGLGELHQFPRVLGQAIGKDPSFARLGELSASTLSEIGASYLDYVSRLSGGRSRTVDTLPTNFEWIPYLLATLPGARIIHCVRDPLAHCIAMYEKLFGQGGYGFSYDLHDLATYYRAYLALTDRWHAEFGNRFLAIDTSPLLEGTAEAWSAIYAFCDLDMPSGSAAPPQSEPELGQQYRREDYERAREALYGEVLAPLLDAPPSRSGAR